MDFPSFFTIACFLYSAAAAMFFVSIFQSFPNGQGMVRPL